MSEEAWFWVCGIMTMTMGALVGLEMALYPPVVFVYLALMLMWVSWLTTSGHKLG